MCLTGSPTTAFLFDGFRVGMGFLTFYKVNHKSKCCGQQQHFSVSKLLLICSPKSSCRLDSLSQLSSLCFVSANREWLLEPSTKKNKFRNTMEALQEASHNKGVSELSRTTLKKS